MTVRDLIRAAVRDAAVCAHVEPLDTSAHAHPVAALTPISGVGIFDAFGRSGGPALYTVGDGVLVSNCALSLN